MIFGDIRGIRKSMVKSTEGLYMVGNLLSLFPLQNFELEMWYATILFVMNVIEFVEKEVVF